MNAIFMPKNTLDKLNIFCYTIYMEIIIASLMSCFLNKTVIYFKPIQPADEVVEVQTVKSETN
jgi:hypothetical protein